MLFYVETDKGCGIRAAACIEDAGDALDREVGQGNWDVCREATDENLAWAKGMLGRIPEDVDDR